jgi:diguanylate cyclase (GGDEF)-like protein
MQLPSTRFDELKATGSLPSPTGVAIEVMRLARSEKTTSAELARVIQADPALTGRLLRLANSSFTGAKRPAACVADAVLRLGLRTVSTVSLAFSILGASRNGICRRFDYDGFWSVSLARAVAMQCLARRLHALSPEDAFTLGLLSRVGELALATIYPEQYTQILSARQSRTSDQTLDDDERAAFGISSVDLSAAMIADWGLPDVFVDAALAQRVPPECAVSSLPRPRQFGALLYLSDRLAIECHRPTEPTEQYAHELAEAMAPLAATPRELAEMLASIRSQWQEWSQLLCVSSDAPGGDLPGYVELKCRPEASAPEQPDAPPAGLSIVVADDDELQRELVAKILRSSGHTVRLAADGQQALKMILNQRSDVVIADWKMPGLNGIDLCLTLRQSKFAQRVYFMLITAAGDDDVLVQAFDAGVDDYVTKPVRLRLLQARMKAAQRLIRVEAAYEEERAEFRRVAGELAIANRKLEQATLIDFLTGLPNRRYLIDRLGQEWAAAQRNARELACLVLDVDHFKAINDQHGHDTGDAVLRALAQLLMDYTRKPDTACRFGGEEFVVVLPETSLEAACQIAERLRIVTQQQLGSRVPALSRPVTVSIGVAARTSEMESFEEMLKRADAALYQAKSRGRNRVCRDGDPSTISLSEAELHAPALA